MRVPRGTGLSSLVCQALDPLFAVGAMWNSFVLRRGRAALFRPRLPLLLVSMEHRPRSHFDLRRQLKTLSVRARLKTTCSFLNLWLSGQMALVVKTVLGSHVGVGEFTTHVRTYFSGWMGMFIGGMGF